MNIKIIGISFSRYLNCAQYFLSYTRIFIKKKWTPFVIIELRKNAKWFGSNDSDIT